MKGSTNHGPGSKGSLVVAHNFCEMILIDYLYLGLNSGTKRLIDNIITGRLAKKTYVVVVECLNNVAKMKMEV